MSDPLSEGDCLRIRLIVREELRKFFKEIAEAQQELLMERKAKQ